MEHHTVSLHILAFNKLHLSMVQLHHVAINKTNTIGYAFKARAKLFVKVGRLFFERHFCIGQLELG